MVMNGVASKQLRCRKPWKNEGYCWHSMGQALSIAGSDEYGLQGWRRAKCNDRSVKLHGCTFQLVFKVFVFVFKDGGNPRMAGNHLFALHL